MTIKIPEVTLYNLIDGLIKHIRADYTSAIDKNDSMLYLIFGDLKHVKKDYFKEAVAVFMSGVDSRRHLEVKLYYDAERAKIPTIHITIPQEVEQHGTIGNQSGNSFPITDASYRDTTFKTFKTTSLIVVTSDNESEVTCIYHALRAMLMSALDTVTIQGLQNPQIGGHEMRMSDHLNPNIFHRGLSLDYSYSIEVPHWYTKDVLADIVTCKFEQDPNNSPKLIEE